MSNHQHQDKPTDPGPAPELELAVAQLREQMAAQIYIQLVAQLIVSQGCDTKLKWAREGAAAARKAAKIFYEP